jgi:hypothetical protein
MTGATIDDEAGDVDEMTDEQDADDESEDEGSGTPAREPNQSA